MVLGIFAITAPMATLSAAIVVLGAPMLAMAGDQLVVLLAPPTHPSQAPVPARRDMAERFGHQTGQADQRGMHPVLKDRVVEPAAAARSH